MKLTVRTDSNFMDHSIDLKGLKSNVHMLYLYLYKLVLIAHAKMPLINAHVNVSDVFETKYFDSENPDEMPHKRHFIRVCSVFYDNIDLLRQRYIINCNPSRYLMGHPDFTVWSIELFLVV